MLLAKSKTDSNRIAMLNYILTLSLLAYLFSCQESGIGPDEVEEPVVEEPYFKPGEYGGTSLPGKEHLYNLMESPDGEKIAFVKRRMLGSINEPVTVLWIVNADGSNPVPIINDVYTVQWSPSGTRLALTLAYEWASYVAIIDLETAELSILTGKEEQTIDREVGINPLWYNSNKLFFEVGAVAYQQEYGFGLYQMVLDEEPAVDPIFSYLLGNSVGYNGRYVIGKINDSNNDLLGNFARLDLETRELNWITTLPEDSVDRIELFKANRANRTVAFQKKVDYAWQLYLCNDDGSSMRQITELGGHNVQWDRQGQKIIFLRDIHKGKGAHHIPHTYNTQNGQIAPLWPHLPDSVPKFPPLSSFTTRPDQGFYIFEFRNHLDL